MNFLNRNYIVFIGVSLGGIIGYFTWSVFNLPTGKYILSNGPFHIVVYGAVVGGLLSNMIKINIKKTGQYV
jgi:hypothetical protein